MDKINAILSKVEPYIWHNVIAFLVFVLIIAAFIWIVTSDSEEYDEDDY